ncbi:GLPGLI family protein [Chryseobacterium angstadtii]|uniref:GLPGLI family protein n=1 Tax=Chryseobacterium angstadtii TaxID=558151 RepID=UPI00065A98AE|nr:GLPGLI family protein [Chryseobacterium angstadtii]
MKTKHQLKFIIFFLSLSAFCFSQKFSFIYETKCRSAKEKPEDIFKDRMVLDFENNRSIFRESLARNADSLKLINKNGGYRTGVENQFYIKKDISNNNVEKIITYLHANYLLPIDEKLNWKILSEQKTIGKYKSQKAEVNYGGRNWIAWFTTELPFNDGPYVFNGLPGLIISIEDTEHDYSFNLVQIKKGGDWFDVRTKTIQIDWPKYDQLGKSYYNDPWNSKSGRKVTFFDPQGNEKDMNEMIRDTQKSILEENNPIELNHKINYK